MPAKFVQIYFDYDFFLFCGLYMSNLVVSGGEFNFFLLFCHPLHSDTTLLPCRA